MDAKEDGRAGAMAAVGRGTIVMVVGTILSLIFNFIGRVAVARAYSVAHWGVFSLGLSLSGFLGIVAVLGLNQAVARALSYEPDPAVRQKVIRAGLWVTVASSVIVSALVYFFAAPIADIFAGSRSPDLVLIVQYFSVTIGFTLLSTYLASIFQGYENAGPNAWFNQVLNPAIFVVFIFVFFGLHLQFFGAILAYVLASALAFAALLWYTIARAPEFVEALRIPRRAPLPDNFWWLTVSFWGVTSLAFITAFVDTMILGGFRSATEVGLYSSAMTLSRLLLVASGALTFIYLPVSARLMKTGQLGAIQWTYATSTRWILVITFPLFLLFAFLPTESLSAVFTSRYDAASLSLSILVIGSFAANAFGPVTACLSGMGNTRTLLWSSVASSVANVGLSFALIPQYGEVGASVAWAVARMIYPGIGAVVLWRAFKVSTLERTFIEPLAIALAVGIPLFLTVHFLDPTPHIVYPMFFVGAAIYVAAILATRSLSEGDLLFVGWLEKFLRRPLPSVHWFLGRFTSRAVSPTIANE